MKKLSIIKSFKNYDVATFQNPYLADRKNIVIINNITQQCNYPIIYENGEIAFDFRPILQVRNYFTVKKIQELKNICENINN